MPRLIPTISIGISRKTGDRNRTVFPTIGEMFDFTEEEVKEISAAHPEALRKPINEAKEVTSEEENGGGGEATAHASRRARKEPARRISTSDEGDEDL